MITYLIGAGASWEVLPLVKTIGDEMYKWVEILKGSKFLLSNAPPYIGENTEYAASLGDVKNQFIKDLEWLHDENKNHASVDTYAKKLYLKKDYNKLKRLKATLSAFFVLLQCNSKYDKRYDTFFASILKQHSYVLPKNIRIISWNYDFQFEKAFNEYLDIKFSEIPILLNVVIPHQTSLVRDQGFAIYKLNGSTHVISSFSAYSEFWIDSFQSELSKEILGKILANYYHVLHIQEHSPGISFAWEKSNNAIISLTSTETSTTDVLVVVGYSFPYFNREVDREIIKNMKFLKKVYFQAPDADSLKERFKTIRPDLEDKNLIVHKDCQQFLLPDELE